MLARFLLVASLALAASTRPAWSDASEPLTAAAERLFALGADPSAKGLRAAQTHYRELPEAVRNAPSLKYAYAVVLIRQKRLSEAAGLLDELAASRPDDLAACRARIWVQLTLGERGKALETLKVLQEQLASRSTSDHDPIAGDQAADRETAELLGGLSGFFAGPWHSRQREGDSKKLREELRARFEGDAQAAFDRSEAQVLARYLQLHEDLQRMSQKARDADKKRIADEQQKLFQAEISLDEEGQALADKDAKRSDEAKAKLAAIDGKLEKLQQRQGAIVQQIVPLEQQREALTVQLLPEPLPFTRLPRQAGPLSAANSRYNDGIRRLLAPIVCQLTLLMGQAAQVQDGIQELQVERYSAVGRRQQDAGKIAGQKQELDRRETRLKRTSKHSKTGAPGNTAQVRAQAARMSLFSTYLDFPFDREKQRILGLLAKH